MSRRDNHSFPLRGVPLELLQTMNVQGIDKNALVLELIRQYAAVLS